MARPRKSTKQNRIAEAKRMVQAAYYSAASDSSSMDFSFASSVTLTDALKADLNTLRTRIKYELRQNAPAKGICRVYANACISTGPSLSVDVEEGNENWAEEIEFEWSEWARNCGFVRNESLAEILHVNVRQFFDCGEYISVDKYDNSAKTPIKLRVMPIRPARLVNPYAISDSIIEGVEFDNQGRPIKYYFDDGSFEPKPESASNVRHIFYQEEPEQVRGEPWLAAGLPDLHKRRRYDEARVAAAIIAAKFAVFLTQESPEQGLTPDDILPEAIIELNDGAATILPPGMGVQSFSGSQPVAGAEGFRKEMIANAGAGVGMSANAANQDSSDSNFASARYDDVGIGIEHKVVRGIIENRDLTPLAEKFITEAEAVGLIGKRPDWYRLIWRWPSASRHTDPLKAANADSKRIESGVGSFAEIWAEQGSSKEQKRQEILEEITWCRKHGIRHPLDASQTSQPATTNNENQPEQEEEDA